MIQVFLIAFGLMCIITEPILLLVGVVVGVIACFYQPDSFPVTGPGRASSARTGDPGISKNKGFTTMKEKQDKWVKELIRPDYDPWSPENRSRTQAIHDVMDRNRKQAQREMADEILREKAEKARKEELGQS